MEVAKDWGLTPWQYDRLENDEKAEMMAFSWVHRLVENYHYEKAEFAAKNKSKSEDANPKRRFG